MKVGCAADMYCIPAEDHRRLLYQDCAVYFLASVTTPLVNQLAVTQLEIVARLDNVPDVKVWST